MPLSDYHGAWELRATFSIKAMAEDLEDEVEKDDCIYVSLLLYNKLP